MSLRISASLLLIAASPLASQLIAADPPTTADLQAQVAALDQQVKILARNAELAKEQADADAAKIKAAIKPTDFQVKVKGYVQGRATLGAKATDSTGKDQDYFNGPSGATVGDQSEGARFSFRRIRLSADFKTATDWFGLLTLRADNLGTSNASSSLTNGSTGGASATFYQAYFGKTFKVGAYEHEIKFGLDKIYNNDSSISSAAGLLAVDRPLATLLSSQREIGIGYFFRAPFLRFGAEIQDNSNLTRTTAATPNDGNASATSGVATSFRIEAAPGADYLPAKKQESYVGAAGTEILVGFDAQNSGKSYAITNEVRNLTLFGPDVLVHHDNLTFLAEYRFSKLDRAATAGALPAGSADSLNGQHWDAQVGYVLPLDLDFQIEPAIRFSAINWSKDDDEKSAWGVNAARDNNVTTPTGLLGATGTATSANLASGASNLGSGTELDLGINLYWNGHANKTQVAYSSWKAEDGDGRAHAVIVQHQLIF